MTHGQKHLIIFFSLYLLIISNTLNVFINNFELNFTFSVLSISIILFISLLSFSYILIFLLKKLTNNIYFYILLIFFYFICLISTIHPNISPPVWSCLQEICTRTDMGLKYIFLINIIVVIFLTSITIKFKIYNFFIVTSLVMILVSTIYSSSVLYTKYTSQNKNFDNNKSLISKKLNIFVISFDNIPSHIIQDEFKKDNDKSYLADFIFFNKYISTAQATHANIIFEMYGNELQKNSRRRKSEYETELKANPNNLFNFTKSNNINTNFYGSYNNLFKKDELLDFKDIEFYEKIILSFHRFIIPSLQRLFTYKMTEIHNGIYLKYNFKEKQSLKQFIKFTKSINDSDYSENVVMHIGHWNFTKPILLNKNCQFVENLPQNILQMPGVAGCSMQLLKKFVSILKTKGIYENSIIIFKSDTGLVSTYYPESDVLSRSKNNSIYGYSLYRPFLMVKSLNTNNLKEVNESIISNIDFANYYCNELNKFIIVKFEKNNCESLGNEDLYNALYLDKTNSNKKINILFDNGSNSHLMFYSILKEIDIIDGNIDEAFLKVFLD